VELDSADPDLPCCAAVLARRLLFGGLAAPLEAVPIEAEPDDRDEPADDEAVAPERELSPLALVDGVAQLAAPPAASPAPPVAAPLVVGAPFGVLLSAVPPDWALSRAAGAPVVRAPVAPAVRWAPGPNIDQPTAALAMIWVPVFAPVPAARTAQIAPAPFVAPGMPLVKLLTDAVPPEALAAVPAGVAAPDRATEPGAAAEGFGTVAPFAADRTGRSVFAIGASPRPTRPDACLRTTTWLR